MPDFNFDKALSTLIRKLVAEDYAILQEDAFKEAIDGLVGKGVIQLKKDHALGGPALELRVRMILQEMKLLVREGRRENLEDLVVAVPDFAKPSIPLVVEVKSGKAASPTRGDLRQLDDWVFELSGEAEIRKNVNVYEDQDPNRTYEWPGAIQPRPPQPRHPSPHKGVLLYNGPLGKPFDQRPIPMLGQNEAQFAQKRSFCVISFPCLLSWSAACNESRQTVQEFWARVQECTGELEHYGTYQGKSAVDQGESE